MDWLNIRRSHLESEEFKGCAPTQRATWLCLLSYCAGQENGGTITNCRAWPDRKWQQVCGVTKDEVMSECPLWQWWGEMGSLRVWNYPQKHQDQAQRNRELAPKAAKSRWARKRQANGQHPPAPKKKPKSTP